MERSPCCAPPDVPANSASGMQGSPTFTGEQPKAPNARAPNTVKLQATTRRFMYPAPIDVRGAGAYPSNDGHPRAERDDEAARYPPRIDDVNSIVFMISVRWSRATRARAFLLYRQSGSTPPIRHGVVPSHACDG